jgi:hypothetical protein
MELDRISVTSVIKHFIVAVILQHIKPLIVKLNRFHANAVKRVLVAGNISQYTNVFTAVKSPLSVINVTVLSTNNLDFKLIALVTLTNGRTRV